MARIAKILMVISGVLLVVGLATYLFQGAEGKVVSLDGYEYKEASYSATEGGAYLYSGRQDKWQRITYMYEVEGSRYQNSFIGFWVPVNLEINASPPDAIKVYYLPSFPSVSVLVRGLDWRLFVGLVAFAACLFGINHFLRNPDKYA